MAGVPAQDAPQPQPAPGIQQKPTRSPHLLRRKRRRPRQRQLLRRRPRPASRRAKTDQAIPADAERHFRRGYCFEHDGNTENAIVEYKEAIKEYPDYFEAHYNLGRLYLDRQGYSDAIAEFKIAIQLRPDDANAHNNLGPGTEARSRSQRRDRRVSGSGDA